MMGTSGVTYYENNALFLDAMENYEQYFKNQLVHPNIAVQNIRYWESSLMAFFELTDDYLINILIERPELVTEANVSTSGS